MLPLQFGPFVQALLITAPPDQMRNVAEQIDRLKLRVERSRPRLINLGTSLVVFINQNVLQWRTIAEYRAVSGYQIVWIDNALPHLRQRSGHKQQLPEAS